MGFDSMEFARVTKANKWETITKGLEGVSDSNFIKLQQLYFSDSEDYSRMFDAVVSNPNIDFESYRKGEIDITGNSITPLEAVQAADSFESAQEA